MIAAALEKALNYVLKLDPDTVLRLNSLQGKVVKLSINDWNFECFVVIRENSLGVMTHYAGVPDAGISGKLKGLLQVGRSRASGPVLFEQGIQVDGDLEVGEQIRDIIRRLDLDFEEYLSRYVGDIAAHEIFWRGKSALRLGMKTWKNFTESVREFCQIEAKYAPSRRQVEEFYRNVSQLRNDAERAAARLDRLEKQILGKEKDF